MLSAALLSVFIYALAHMVTSEGEIFRVVQNVVCRVNKTHSIEEKHCNCNIQQWQDRVGPLQHHRGFQQNNLERKRETKITV